MLFKFFDQWRSITSNRFVLNMVWGHHLQLRSSPPLFHDSWCINVKAAAPHHPVIHKEVDELLPMGATEPSSGGAGFYSIVFVVPKHTGGHQPIFNLKCFNHYIPPFKMPTLKHVWQLIQHGDYAFSIDLQDAYLHVPIVKHHLCFLHFVGVMCLISGRFYNLGLPQPLGFLYSSPNLFCSFAFAKVYVLSSIWMTSWSSFALNRWGKRACLFLCSLLVRVGLNTNFSKSDFHLYQTFCFLGLCWDTVHISVSLPPDKLADIQQLALSLL